MIEDGSEALWSYAERMVRLAVERGYLQERS
jgi:hypothetical protein